MKRPLVIFAVVVLAAVLLVIGYLGGRRQATTVPAPAHSSTTAPDTAGKVLYWYDPMAPEQHFDKPGLSPMGMEMVPRYADAGGAAGGVVRIDPATVQNLGVRTAPVERRVLASAIRLPGTIPWDLRQAIIIRDRKSTRLKSSH